MKRLILWVDECRHKHLICLPRDRRIPMVFPLTRTWFCLDISQCFTFHSSDFYLSIQVRLATRQGLRLVSQRFVIKITGWEQDAKYPAGHVVRVLGPIGDLNTETVAILVENEISTAPFSSL